MSCSCAIIFKYKTALEEETKSILEVWGIVKNNCKINYFDIKINDNWKTGSGNDKKMTEFVITTNSQESKKFIIRFYSI